MKYQKIALLPVESFEQLKNSILDESQLCNLDQQLYKILRNKKLNEYEKFLMYKQNLIQHSKILQKNHFNDDDVKGPNLKNNSTIKHVEGKSSQTKMIFNDENSSQTEKPLTGDAITQTCPSISQIVPSLETIFESSNPYDSLRVDDDEENFSHDYNLTGERMSTSPDVNFSGKTPSTTIKRKISTDPNFSIYEMDDNSVVTRYKEDKKKKRIKESKKSTSTPQKKWQSIYKY